MTSVALGWLLVLALHSGQATVHREPTHRACVLRGDLAVLTHHARGFHCFALYSTNQQ